MNLLYKKAIKENYTVIVGCGRLGADIANALSDRGESVLVIDNRQLAFRKLSPSFGGLTLTGDATDLDILQEAQCHRATTLIVVTNNDNINIMASQLAKEVFHVPHVIARLYNPDCKCVYDAFDIATICPSLLSAREINSLLQSKEGM